jgi:hypothetical protein
MRTQSMPDIISYTVLPAEYGICTVSRIRIGQGPRPEPNTDSTDRVNPVSGQGGPCNEFIYPTIYKA